MKAIFLTLNKPQIDYKKLNKEEFREICLKNLELIKDKELPEIPKESIYEAVLIEFRILPHIEYIIRNNILKLGNEWSYTIVCGKVNHDWVVELCKSISHSIRIIKLDYDNVLPKVYSTILTTPSFWESLKGQKILIHQEDSLIFKDNIKDFITWDYIGAPWKKSDKVNTRNVGNGGFSLRSKATMLQILNRKKMANVHPEDVFFTTSMIYYRLGKIADYDTASNFSSENVFNKNSFGGHCFWLGCNQWRDLLKLN